MRTFVLRARHTLQHQLGREQSPEQSARVRCHADAVAPRFVALLARKPERVETQRNLAMTLSRLKPMVLRRLIVGCQQPFAANFRGAKPIIGRLRNLRPTSAWGTKVVPHDV
jgi:hypothetical protein